ncbi:aldehyde dehydrogenase family protein [Streptomyces fuscichromogenes]|uniref:aldehyde dehydrogenase (NAD(+)) n=1 Tax=Streptomyces fuscichromogenes TaxID=1324013 RepID=A0A917UI57_9ACTN|nr:aldehyde dehydrogenase family protein [Streptomyces fuscichromogenes]GGM97272.1 aldehyde dehydrogenase [Streptomyces fuscichromogenes]
MHDLVRHYIDGVWDEPGADPGVIDVVDPATLKPIGATVAGTSTDVDRAVRAARRAFPGWSALPATRRIEAVRRLAEALDAHRDRLAVTLTSEMGSPLAFSRQAQVGVAIADLEALIEAAENLAGPTPVSDSLVVTEPVGVVAAITPWNFPLHQIVLKAGAALLAGCTVVLKPSEVAPLNAAVLTELIHGLGLPDGTFNVVFGDGSAVGEPLCAHPDVDMVTFTGSRAVGERVARTAASTIKKVALELGGKSAAIALDDADTASTAAQVVRSCFANTGQTCAALTRLLVPRESLDDWYEAVVTEAADWWPGDPFLAGTVMGPLASLVQLERVRRHIDQAVREGARLLTGGTDILPSLAAGAYIAPTVLGAVTPDMKIFREEVFGPVLAITGYDDEDHAVELANDSDYGLSGGVWSADPLRALEVARRLRTGTVGINGAGLDVGAPFGGYKQSGIGRECGAQGLAEFLETKTVMGARDLHTSL